MAAAAGDDQATAPGRPVEEEATAAGRPVEEEATQGKLEEGHFERLPQLWEQWGLLGFFVGVLVGLGGAGVLEIDLLEAIKGIGQRAWDFIQLQLAPKVAELEATVGDAVPAEVADPAGIAEVAEAAGASDVLAEAAAQAAAQAPMLGEAVPGVTTGALAEVAEAVAAAASVLPLDAVLPVAAWSSLVSGVGVLAGLLVDGIQEPTVPRAEKGYVDPPGLTPGTTRIGIGEVTYDVLCWFIDVVFEDRPVQRFWFLETVARMPYFAYTSVLHLYETLGWWRSPELRAVHAAEEDNELHHLLIMESLGGDRRWLDRFFAQHGAVAYYWILVLFFVIDPRWSYNFSRLIEAHAVDTYGEFVDANAEELKKLPPPPIAIQYYRKSQLYMFDMFQTETRARGELRRPPCATLYDVFSNIRDDEEQHVLTMKACEEWVTGGAPPVSLGISNLSREEYEEEIVKDPEGRKAWMSWGDEVNALLKDA